MRGPQKHEFAQTGSLTNGFVVPDVSPPTSNQYELLVNELNEFFKAQPFQVTYKNVWWENENHFFAILRKIPF
jgi:hypothetical protein